MRSLPSSAEHRIQRLKGELVLSVHEKCGSSWAAIHDIRARRGIEVVTQLPPSRGPGFYLPPDHPEFAKPADAGYKEWLTYVRRWGDELRTLHDQVIPEECRVGTVDEISQVMWEKFLSACVVYDPPVPGLVEFRDRVDLGMESGPDPPDMGPEYYAYALPIRQMRDPEKAERAQQEFYWRLIEYLTERYIEPQGLDIEDVLRDALKNTPGLWKGLQEANVQNPPRYLIDPKPWHTEEDVRNAFRMLAAAHTERPQLGRARRDPLIAAECAILKDRHGWQNRRLAEQLLRLYGLQEDENLASRYVTTGRKILKDMGQN